jgi:hypothetical protein
MKHPFRSGAFVCEASTHSCRSSSSPMRSVRARITKPWSRVRQYNIELSYQMHTHTHTERERKRKIVCVCVCVCVRTGSACAKAACRLSMPHRSSSQRPGGAETDVAVVVMQCHCVCAPRDVSETVLHGVCVCVCACVCVCVCVVCVCVCTYRMCVRHAYACGSPLPSALHVCVLTVALRLLLLRV